MPNKGPLSPADLTAHAFGQYKLLNEVIGHVLGDVPPDGPPSRDTDHLIFRRSVDERFEYMEVHNVRRLNGRLVFWHLRIGKNARTGEHRAEVWARFTTEGSATVQRFPEVDLSLRLTSDEAQALVSRASWDAHFPYVPRSWWSLLFHPDNGSAAQARFVQLLSVDPVAVEHVRTSLSRKLQHVPAAGKPLEIDLSGHEASPAMHVFARMVLKPQDP